MLPFTYTIRLVTPRKLLTVQLLYQQYGRYEDITTVQDRLRWCRHHMGLMQKEVAEQIGISRGHYIDLEAGTVDYYPKEIVDKLSELFHIPPEDLLDDYNRFLYYGQGQAIREHREHLGLAKKPYARHMGMEPNSLREWESEQTRISKKCWEKYFKDVITL